MLLAGKAWRLRERAREALSEGDVQRALRLNEAAEQLRRTPAGESLRMVGRVLRLLSQR
jgi:hypothetical protein